MAKKNCSKSDGVYCAECGEQLPRGYRSNLCMECLSKILADTEVFDS